MPTILFSEKETFTELEKALHIVFLFIAARWQAGTERENGGRTSRILNEFVMKRRMLLQLRCLGEL